jgi:four helix bundle protein
MGTTGYVPIEELEFFRELEELAEAVWRDVARWQNFEKNTIGTQLVRALDSVGANLVEGDGRHSDHESLHFFSIARGSAREARLWLHRAQLRGLMTSDEHVSRLESVVRRLNALISTRRRNATRVRDAAIYYNAVPNDLTT